LRVSRSFPLALTLMLGFGVLSCAVPPAPQLQQAARLGSATLTLVPRVKEATFTQALVTRPTSGSIARLDIFPMVETTPGVYQPLKADGMPTALGDAEAIRVTQTQPDLRLGRPVALTGLAPDTRYRILARAYDAQDKLLSMDETSVVDVAVTRDDSLETTPIPVMLADVPFAAATTITLRNAAVSSYASVETQLVAVAGGVETLVPGSTQTLLKSQIPLALKLGGLRADSLYRLNAVLRDAGNAQVATASVEIQVTNDDAPSGQTLSLATLPETILAGAFPSKASGLMDGNRNAARFNTPFGLARDTSGNLYVADYFNHAIRMISPAGGVTTVAGAYPTKTTGLVDGALGDARFNQPTGIVIDASGNLYIADYNNHAIRMIPKTSGVYFGKSMTANQVTTLAGSYPTKASGLVDGALGNARFYQPASIAIDASGNLYIADYGNHAIRMIPKTSGVYFGKSMTANEVTTLAGAYPTATSGLVDDALSSARFQNPAALALDASGNLYIADNNNHAIRVIPKADGTYFGKSMTANQVTTLAGSYPTKAFGLVDGALGDARFQNPIGMTFDAAGNLYIVDSQNHALRMIPKTSGTSFGKPVTANAVTTILGGYPTKSPGFTDASGSDARLTTPMDIVIDASGSFYVTDGGNHAIRVFK